MSFKTSGKTKQAAEQLLTYARQRLTRLNPLLLQSVYLLKPQMREAPGPLSTDGVHLQYNPQQVIDDFRADPDSVARQLLHITLHGLLGHLPLRKSYKRTALFDAAADLKVCHTAMSLCGVSFVTGRAGRVEFSGSSMPPLTRFYDQLKHDLPHLKQVMKVHPNTGSDDHAYWNPKHLVLEEGEEIPSDSIWREAAQNMVRHLKGLHGSSAEHRYLLAQLDWDTSPSTLSYEKLLEQLASPREQLKLDPDSLDVRWYTLGLALYGDIPLVEPDELSEQPSTEDLIIALDTSGSCDGDICARFLRETLNLLGQITDHSQRLRVLLIQCDTEIQEALLIDDISQVDNLTEDFQPIGGGGTDFCPVFDLVDDLRADGTLAQVRGLIYFSDADGGFPSEKPDYPVHFILPPEEDLYVSEDTPSWVRLHQLDQNGSTLKEVSA